MSGSPTALSEEEEPWNETNPEWWRLQVESRGEYAWPWLVNEWASLGRSNRCGCTIHDDRGEPCQNPANLCHPCEQVCWGFRYPLLETVEAILANPSVYHDAGSITSALREALHPTRGLSPLEVAGFSDSDQAWDERFAEWNRHRYPKAILPLMPLTQEDVDDLYGGIPPKGRKVL